jgi:hypothetical protein
MSGAGGQSDSDRIEDERDKGANTAAAQDLRAGCT